jgi:hypothetical protein
MAIAVWVRDVPPRVLADLYLQTGAGPAGRRRRRRSGGWSATPTLMQWPGSARCELCSSLLRRHAGHSDLDSCAREMPNLLPPQPVGAMAAIKACLDADVIFVAPDLETSPASRHLTELPDRPGDPRQVRAGAFCRLGAAGG